jgi:hypothetical protein
VGQAQMSIGSLAKNSRHGTSDGAEAEQGHVTGVCVKRIAFFGRITFRATNHRSIIAEADWRLRGFEPNSNLIFSPKGTPAKLSACWQRG